MSGGTHRPGVAPRRGASRPSRSRRNRARQGFLSILLGLCMVLVPSLACSGDGAPGGSPDHVRSVVLPYFTHAPFHIAAAEGLFTEHGLDVEFVRLGRPQDVMTALAQGDVDAAAGLLTVNELGLAARGARVRVVSALAELRPEDCPHTAFLARREHLESGALQDRDRLRRLRFDVNPLLPLGYWLDTLLRPYDLTLDDLDTVDLTSPAALDAMAKGTVDVTVDSEPWINRHVASGEVAVWKPVGQLLPGYVLDVMVYGPTLLDERPAVGKRFATAVLEAIRRYNRGKTPRNCAIIQQATGLTAEQVAEICWVRMSDDARVDPAVFRGYQEWAVARGLLDRVLADEELFDHRFIDHANAALAR